MIESALRDRSLHRPADKAEAVEEVLPYIRAVNSRIQKREYFDMAMDSLGIDRENVNTSAWRRELWQAVRDNRLHESSAVHAVAKQSESDGRGTASAWIACWLMRICDTKCCRC